MGSVGGVRFGLGVISVVACSGVEAECVLVVTVDNTAVASVVVLTGVAVIFPLPASSSLPPEFHLCRMRRLSRLGVPYRVNEC